MPAILGIAAKYLLKAFVTDPKGVLKAIFWILILPIILIATIIVAPLGIFSHIPMVETGQHQDYINVVEAIENETGVLINFNNLVGIHAVVFEQNFDQVKLRDIETLAWRFIHEYEEERTRMVEVEKDVIAPKKIEVQKEIQVEYTEIVSVPIKKTIYKTRQVVKISLCYDSWDTRRMFSRPCFSLVVETYPVSIIEHVDKEVKRTKTEIITETKTVYSTEKIIENVEETYTVIVYELRSLETVLNALVSENILNSEDLEHVNRYTQFVGMDETQIDLDDIPIITDAIFIRSATGNITSGFGQRWGRLHAGLDIGGNGRTGVPIVAAADGTVRRSYFSSSYGEVIIITHNINGVIWETLYGHMVTGSRKYHPGQTVSKGDVIGIMGTTGNSTGIHLHFELHKGLWNPSRSNAVNPIYYIQF